MLALVTATYNSKATLPATLESTSSVRDRIKLVFIDGGSADGTIEYLRSYVASTENAILELQRAPGLYQAINQGVQVALADPQVTHIAMLHSNDCLRPNSYSRYIDLIMQDPADVFYSDIEFHNEQGLIVRKWRAGEYSRWKLRTGWMPPHTSVVVRKSVYKRLGVYDPDFGTAADYEWLVRVCLDRDEKIRYFPEPTLSMLVGGASSASLVARLRANMMDGKVWAKYSRTPSIVIRVCKPMRKLGQFVSLK